MHHTLQTTQIHAVLTIPIPTSSHLQSGLFIKYFKQSLISEGSLNTFKAGQPFSPPNASHLQIIYSNQLNYMLFTKNSQISLWLHVIYCLINILPSAVSTIFYIPTIYLTPTLNVIYLQKPFPFPDRNIFFYHRF